MAKKLLMLIMAVLLMSTACSAVTGDSETSGDDQLRIALGVDVTTLHPWMTQTVETDLSVLSQVYSTLVVRNADLELEPQLATSWKRSGKTWRFELRDDATFSNGDPFDADVVKWNIEEIQRPETEARVVGTVENITAVDVIDAQTVDITTQNVDTTLPASLTFIFMLDPKWAEANDPTSEMMGTGPYELQKRTEGSSIALTRRDDYWADEPAYENVEYTILSETSTQISSLQTGEIDVVTGFGPDQLDQLQGLDGVEAGSVESTRSAFVLLNTLDKGPLSDVRVRRALNYAVDKQGIVEQLLHGSTTESQGQIVTDAYTGYSPDITGYEYDPEEAKRLLADAGYPNGFKLTLQDPTGRYLVSDQIVQAVAADLKAVGVDTNVESIDFTTYIENLYSQKLPGAGYLAIAWPTLDAYGSVALFAPQGEESFWDNPAMSQKMEQVRSASDATERTGYLQEAAEIVRDEAPFLFLFPQPFIYAYSTDVAWTPREDGWVRAYEMAPSD